MRIGILYICTGKYSIFWKDFFLSCEKNFIPEVEKHYFVFTDSQEIEFEKENKNITKIYQENLGWPLNTLKRYAMFSKIIPDLEKFDYLFFFNANLLFIEKITAEEFLPAGDKKLVGCLHPAFYNKKLSAYPYDKNIKSLAGLDSKSWYHYYQGAINGGEAKEFIKVIRQLRDNTEIDLNNKVIALWHDESHWNKYLNEHQNITKTLTPSYLYPEGFSLPFEPKILIRGKNKYFGGLNQIRNLKQSLNIGYLRDIIRRIKNKIIYKTFSFYDSIFCSYFLVSKLKENIKFHDSRKISVAITSYNREKIIHKSLKNIINNGQIDEIVIVDDGSSADSFKKTLLKITSLKKEKIKVYRREDNLGVLATKIEAVSLCKNDWVILLDSDNTICKSYLNSIYRVNNWDVKTIYCPDFAWPLLDFRTLANETLDFKKTKELLIRKTSVVEKFLNDGNFFFNKDHFLDIFNKYKFFKANVLDILFINYIWLTLENKICVLPDSKYLHRVNDDSVWKEFSNSSAPLFEKLRTKIMMGEKENYEVLKKEIGLTGKTEHNIQRII